MFYSLTFRTTMCTYTRSGTKISKKCGIMIFLTQYYISTLFQSPQDVNLLKLQQKSKRKSECFQIILLHFTIVIVILHIVAFVAIPIPNIVHLFMNSL